MNKLVIISIPFWRVAKVVLNKKIINSLIENGCNIIIISSMNVIDSFNFETDKSKIKNIVWKPKFNKFLFRLYNISETMRMNGYWYKNKKNGLNYYYQNSFNNFSEDGFDTRKPMHSRLLLFIFSILGSWKDSWLLIDKFISQFYNYPKELNSLILSYDKVAFIQSCSWGEQDRILASWARNKNVETHLIPYTTDQLTINGYLLSNYKKIFVQGSLEFDYALKYHKVKKSSIIQAGSFWFRNIDSMNISNKNSQIGNKLILYAGVLPLYYPRENEIKVIKFLCEELFIIRKNKNLKFVYRPYISSNEEKRSIEESLNSYSDCLELQWPDININSLDSNKTLSFEDQIKKDIINLSGIDIFVMSLSTSMCLDAAYISKCFVISNTIDESLILKARHTYDGLIIDNTLRYLPGVEVLNTYELLLSEILNKLNDKSISSSIFANNILKSWDYNNRITIDLHNFIFPS